MDFLIQDYERELTLQGEMYIDGCNPGKTDYYERFWKPTGE